MKIINLYAENLKRLTAVQITPDGNLVQITGKNGQGKTSVLDAIWWALDGSKNVQTTPIRKGEERAIIRLDLGDLKITRRFNAQEDGTYTTSITVENGEGARFSSPQSMLDKLLGELTFDPLAFTRMKSADQVLALRSLVPDFDFHKNEETIKTAFARRTEYNRDYNMAKAEAESISRTLPKDIPAHASAAELMQTWQDAIAHNQLIEARQAKRDTFTEAHEALKQQIEALQEQCADNEAQIASWDALPAPIDAATIKDKLQSAEENNKAAAAAKKRDELVIKAEAANAESIALSAMIEAKKAEAQAAIAGAKMPVDGISIDDGAIMLDGIPFDQASDAQQLQASIGIAMALNPTLKVIRVRDGSLLDDEAMTVLASMAEANDYQIWIERVDSTGTIGFVLEDGHVKGQEIEPEKKPEPKQAKEEKPEPETKAAPMTAGERIRAEKAKRSLFDNDRA